MSLLLAWSLASSPSCIFCESSWRIRTWPLTPYIFSSRLSRHRYPSGRGMCCGARSDDQIGARARQRRTSACNVCTHRKRLRALSRRQGQVRLQADCGQGFRYDGDQLGKLVAVELSSIWYRNGLKEVKEDVLFHLRCICRGRLELL
jgi:hypothetical protein